MTKTSRLSGRGHDSNRRQEPLSPRERGVLRRLVENDLIRRVSYEDYKHKVQRVYGGPRGAMLAAASMISLHLPLGERLFHKRRFDLTGCRRMLDVGSGAGQLAQHLIKYSDSRARITCVDLSPEMLRRSRGRLRNFEMRVRHGVPRQGRLDYVVADLCHLPFPSESFDCITCGYVLEHLPDARLGLAELARVLEPGGRMLLLATEDTFSGAWTSRLWVCRTYNRKELADVSHQLGLDWKQELWFTQLHRLLRAGGICVEMQKAR